MICIPPLNGEKNLSGGLTFLDLAVELVGHAAGVDDGHERTHLALRLRQRAPAHDLHPDPVT